MCKAIEACSCGAILYVEDEMGPLGGRIVFDHDKCDACGLCVMACCGSAIEMRWFMFLQISKIGKDLYVLEISTCP
jgi:ferredoxin